MYRDWHHGQEPSSSSIGRYDPAGRARHFKQHAGKHLGLFHVIVLFAPIQFADCSKIFYIPNVARIISYITLVP